MRSAFCRALLVAFVSCGAIMLAGPVPSMSSRWLDRSITIDGQGDDWEGALVEIEDTPLSVGAFNDGRFLYLCLTAAEPRVRAQILRSGLIVWFDGRGGTKKAFGIKYPVGELPMAPPPGGRGGRSERRPPPQSQIDAEPPNRLELLGSKEEDRRTLLLERVPGIDVHLGRTADVVSVAGTGVPGYEVPRYGRPADAFGRAGLIYELRLPLQASNELPFAVGAAPGDTIGFGIETPKPPTGGPPGLGRVFGMQGPGGMGRGGGGPGGRGRGGLRREALKLIKLWTTIRLASAASGR